MPLLPLRVYISAFDGTVFLTLGGTHVGRRQPISYFRKLTVMLYFKTFSGESFWRSKR